MQMTGTKRICSWLIDSGVSYHITRDTSQLTNARFVQDFLVGFPNKYNAYAKMEGDVYLTKYRVYVKACFICSTI